MLLVLSGVRVCVTSLPVSCPCNQAHHLHLPVFIALLPHTSLSVACHVVCRGCVCQFSWFVFSPVFSSIVCLCSLTVIFVFTLSVVIQ